jgi:hypothetical protein
VYGNDGSAICRVNFEMPGISERRREGIFVMTVNKSAFERPFIVLHLKEGERERETSQEALNAAIKNGIKTNVPLLRGLKIRKCEVRLIFNSW